MFYTKRDPFAGSALPTLPVGLMMLRVVAGFVFFMHGYEKVVTLGLDGTESYFSEVGVPVPAYTAPVIAYLELIGGVMLMIGLVTQLVAALLLVDMIAMMFIIHFENGFFATDNGYELVFLLAGAALALVLTGPGAYSVDNLLPGANISARTRT